MDKNYIKLNLENYYFDNLTENELDDLIKIGYEENLNIFKKKKQKFKLNDSRKIIKECNKKKCTILKDNKKEVQKLSTSSTNIISNLQNINNKTITKLKKIDNVLELIDKKYLEKYEN